MLISLRRTLLLALCLLVVPRSTPLRAEFLEAIDDGLGDVWHFLIFWDSDDSGRRRRGAPGGDPNPPPPPPPPSAEPPLPGGDPDPLDPLPPCDSDLPPPAPVPEPHTLALLALGGGLCAALRRGRRQRQP